MIQSAREVERLFARLSEVDDDCLLAIEAASRTCCLHFRATKARHRASTSRSRCGPRASFGLLRESSLP